MIRAFNKQKTENARFEEANEDYAMTAMAAGRDHKPSDARYQCDLRSDDGGWYWAWAHIM